MPRDPLGVEPRTFPGDPNPPVAPPEVKTSSAPAASGTAESGPAPKGGPQEGAAVEPSKPASTVYRVSSDGNGQSSVYAMDDKLETRRLGAVSIDGADEVLHQLGEFNPTSKTWTVPEDVAMKLVGGRLPLPAYLEAKWAGGEAAAVSGMIGRQWLDGKVPLKDALERTDPALLTTQLKEQPVFAYQGGIASTVAKVWKDLKEAGVSGVARRTAGEIAGSAPDLVQMFGEGSTDAMIGGAGVGLLALAAGVPAAPLALAAGGVGLTYGIFKHVFDNSAGNTGLELVRKGFDESTAKTLAPLAGALNGALMVGQVKFMTAGLQRTFLETVLKSETMKGVMARYVAEVSAGTSLVAAQKVVDIGVNDLAAQLENKPDLLTKTPVSDVVNAIVTGAPVMAAFALPGAGLEMMQVRADTAAETAKAKEVTSRLAARQEGAASQTRLGPQEAGQSALPETTSSSPGSQQSSPGNLAESQKALSSSITPESVRVKAEETARPVLEELAKARGGDAADPKFALEMYREYNNRLHIAKEKAGLTDSPDMVSMTSEQKMKVRMEKIAKLSPEEKTQLEQELFETGRVTVALERKAQMDTNPGIGAVYAARDVKAETMQRASEAADAQRAAAEQARAGQEYAGQVTSAEDLARQVEAGKLTQEEAAKKAAAEVVPPTPREPGKTFESRVHDAESRGRVAALQSDLADVGRLITELEQVRGRFERIGKSTRLLDGKLEELLNQEEQIKQDITFHEAAKNETLVLPHESLKVKPATLESIANLGFKEGRKEVLDSRRHQILDIAKANGLTQADLRLLLHEKNYGTMSDAEFEHWLNQGGTREGEHVPSFREQVAAHVERKTARAELKGVQKEQAIVHEQYVRQLHELPPIAKMTTKQLRDYAEILRGYDKGDEALTPLRIKALETTELKGARTKGEVRQRAAVLMNSPLEAFRTVKISERDMFTPDPQLAQKDPLRGFMVTRTKEFQIRAERAAHETLEVLRGLARTAQDERRALMGPLTRALDRFVPQQKELMAYIEADKGAVYAGQVTPPDVTPGEKAYADAWLAFSDRVRKYLFETGELTSTRFAGNYVPHVHRGLLEMAKELPQTGLRAAVTELYDRLKTPAGLPTDEMAKALGMRKAFDYTEFRSGNLRPSSNVFEVVEHYVRVFHNKVALDEAVPLINTVVRAFGPEMEKTPEGEQLFKSILSFTDQYLSAKKGDARWMWAKGGHVESALRMGMSLTALKHIAVNLALQAMSPIGEATGEFMSIGNRGIARAWGRRFTEDGQAILEKYPMVRSEGPFELLHPGSDIGDAAKAVMYGAFRSMRKQVMGDVLLASLTPEELKSQTVSDARLAQIRLEAGKWIDVHGNKSIRGASVMGSEWTQFKSWAIPPMLSIAEDATALVKRMGGDKGALKPEHIRDFYHLAQLGVMAVMYKAWADQQVEDDTFVGRSIHYARGEVLSMFQGPAAVAGMLAGGVVMTEAAKLAKNVMLLASLEEYKVGDKEGQLKGWDALMKQFTPAAVKQFQTKDEGK